MGTNKIIRKILIVGSDGNWFLYFQKFKESSFEIYGTSEAITKSRVKFDL